MKTIPLTKGKFAIVNTYDYEFLMQWKWHVCEGHNTDYAMRNSKPDPITKKRHHIMMHRVLADTPDGMDTDHKNGNGLDNRRRNLRTCSRSQNMHNRRPNKKGTSKHKGVYWHKQSKKWRAYIQINKERIYLGGFKKEKDAATAYSKKSKSEFKNFNKEVKK